jgi:hypothetical protein
MDVRLGQLTAGQEDLVAAWQLIRLGWSRAKVAHWTLQRGWRRIH